jgi:hypothetical protein
MENLMNLKSVSLLKWVLKGAGLSMALIFLFIIFLFIFGSGNVLKDKSIREFFPLITGTLGGAFGGLIFGLINTIFQTNVWNNYIAKGLGVLAYFIIVWISLILGFSVIGQWD